MTALKRVCVFAGSSSGTRASYTAAAAGLGRLLSGRGIGVVYGGASVGLMTAVADAALANGGEVIGVIPRLLVDLEIAHPGLSELKIVGSMHERKALMSELSDGFIALPGALGTLEEVFEVLTWAQLGYHRKPCGLLNVEGYYDRLLDFLDHTVSEGLLRQQNRDTLLVAENGEMLLEQFETYEPAHVEKWIDRRDQL